MTAPSWSQTVAAMAAMAFISLSAVSAVHGAGADWNDANIRWMGYHEGLEAARKTGKPVCLIFYTTWCPHCTNYSKVFSDPRLVEKSKQFVMIRLDKDKNAELSAKYAPDGEYIPRTYFLSPQGELDPSLTAERPQYKYFYDETKADGLLAGMERALAKLK